MSTSPSVVQNLYQSLQQSVESRSECTALFFEGHKYSYRQFQQNVQASLFCLTDHFGLQKGDVIVLALGNRPEFCFLFYAAMALGMVVVPLSTKLKSDDSLAILESVDARVIFYDSDYQPWLGSIASETQQSVRVSLSNWQFMVRNIDNPPTGRLQIQTAVNKDDVAAIIYTSGTTGSPKGATITHDNFLHAVNAYQLALGLNENDSTVLPIPICHITGLSALLCLFIHIGGTIHLHQRFNAEEVLRAIEQYDITFLHGSPTVFILLTQQAEKEQKNYDYSSLRTIACGAGHLNTGIIDKLSAIFPHTEIRPIYGLTETTSPASIFPGDVRHSEKKGSSGLPVPGLEFQVRDGDNRILPTGEVGHLWLKGPVVIKRYWNNEKINRQYFNDNWFYTGDIASVDKDNYLYIKDRSKDMINRGGEKIYCLEIENLISNYPGVKDIAIVPRHSDIYGEEAVAFIIADKARPLVSDNITQWLSERIAKFKIPSKIIFISELPKNANGKTDKIALRQRANGS
ncbi:class I adenylate-forming enzyme family protein [Citrobacter farmeri]